MNPVITVSGLTCRFGGWRGVEAVRELTLAVPEGSIYAFLGTNGAGKTTTIKALLNLVVPTSGTCTLLGVPSAKIGPAELAQIGYVSENQKLPEALTVRELIAYSRALYPTWDDAFCRTLVEKLALPLDRKVKHFSRGMKMKAALLISLAYRPKLLLLDEPFAGLDPLVREEFIEALRELSREGNWTVFISSHDIDEVERLADWIGIIDAGRLCLSESLATLRARPMPDGSPFSLRDLFLTVTRTLRQNPAARF
ncbi:ABC-2 type transport system ATP-binding protein [Verrucomicrobium sp. GAS474]|uniref:ABC transporter ATP-binding protein n=1 Tax=Verrucomicrobium sp. GAS474 TaxID=1882831 RepID=UPI00087C3BB1|nr:ABC transporter ATP-binding protein [Verrucomicrobium sp. GAS474]SDT98533.1 ABC-2 type transport system ATP-binding protein [Verrucomicrobium sp. GAS474]